MIEKIIYLESIDPQDFYGPGSRNLNKLTSFFPKIKIIARNDEMKLYGEPAEIDRFETILGNLIIRFHQRNRISEEDIDMFMENNNFSLPDREGSDKDLIIYGNAGKAIKARSVNQRKLVDAYRKNDLIFATGPAGSGKTYTAIALAVKALREKEVKRIILTRPAVEAGEKLGFLPGDVRQKLDPYLQPLYDALRDMIPPKKLEGHIEEGIIEIAPLAYMRGRTLGDAFVILDEGQNTTIKQLKMFLTRMGNNAKFVITGDITQIDLPGHSQSGLIRALALLSDVKGISVIAFDKGDIIRHKLVKYIVEAYESDESINRE